MNKTGELTHKNTHDNLMERVLYHIQSGFYLFVFHFPQRAKRMILPEFPGKFSQIWHTNAIGIFLRNTNRCIFSKFSSCPTNCNFSVMSDSVIEISS